MTGIKIYNLFHPFYINLETGCCTLLIIWYQISRCQRKNFIAKHRGAGRKKITSRFFLLPEIFYRIIDEKLRNPVIESVNLIQSIENVTSMEAVSREYAFMNMTFDFFTSDHAPSSMQNVSRPIIIDIFIRRLKYRSITFIQLCICIYMIWTSACVLNRRKF